MENADAKKALGDSTPPKVENEKSLSEVAAPVGSGRVELDGDTVNIN